MESDLNNNLPIPVFDGSDDFLYPLEDYYAKGYVPINIDFENAKKPIHRDPAKNILTLSEEEIKTLRLKVKKKLKKIFGVIPIHDDFTMDCKLLH